MTYSMASLIKKTIRGKTYYYARECRRVDGKPKIVWQKYLGRADDIIAALTQPTTPLATAPEKAVVTEFGAVVALYDLARRLRLVEHIDRHVPARRGPRGPSVGTLPAGRRPQSLPRSPQQGADRRLVSNARRCAASWTSARSN